MAQGAALGLFVFPCPATFFPSELCNGRSRRTWPFRRPSVFHLDNAERMIEAIADRYRLLLIRLGAVRDARDSLLRVCRRTTLSDACADPHYGSSIRGSRCGHEASQSGDG